MQAAGPSASPRTPGSHPVARQATVTAMAARAGRSKVAEKTSTGKGRSGNKKPWTTPPSPIKAKTRKVIYGKTDLSEKALAYQKKHDYWAGKNLAVVEYKDAHGVRRTVIAISDTGVHSEKAARRALQAKGVKASQVTRIYSEREPCMLPGAFCGKFIDEAFPHLDDGAVTYSFEYGDLASRVRGNLLMRQTLSALK